MFYDVFVSLCNKKGVAPTRAAMDIGLSKSTPTTWKKRGLTPQGETLNKIAAYFDVSTDYLLGNEKENDTAPYIEDDSEEFIILNRAAKKMTPEKRKKLLEMAKLMFAEDFNEDE